MNWIVKYIQDEFWPGGIKTERGWESHLMISSLSFSNEPDYYIGNYNEAPFIFSDINKAHRVCELKNRSKSKSYRYIVEEFTQ